MLKLLMLAATTLLVSALPTAETPVNSTSCNGKSYQYLELAGYGFTPSNARDKFGDTAGGLGSSAAIDPLSIRPRIGSLGAFSGIIWTLPDRGWNTEGTLNYQPRVHKFQFNFYPADRSGKPNLNLTYVDTILFTDPAGQPLTGLDPDARGPYLTFPGFPELPSATYTGDGFGGNGTGGRRVSLDSEGLVLDFDGSFWVSDEYGPYVYHFSQTGKMIEAIRPPQPFIPIRNDTTSFSANSPPRYDPSRTVIPKLNPLGRKNNQGFEALTASPDGRHLYTMLQTALDQDGGLVTNGNRYTRLLKYEKRTRQVVGEYVVPLPLYNGGKVAGQSEIKFISDTQFLVLSRDGGAGAGQKNTQSLYRHVDVFDISNATSIPINQTSIATNGVLNAGIQPAEYCSFLDFNVNSQLNKFGVHNGGLQDSGLLNEKWESLALVPTLLAKDEYYLFSLSDNDFITQDGYLKGGQFQYKDESGFNLLNQVLVFKVKLPSGSLPRIG